MNFVLWCLVLPLGFVVGFVVSNISPSEFELPKVVN